MCENHLTFSLIHKWTKKYGDISDERQRWRYGLSSDVRRSDNLISGLRPMLSGLVSVFGLSERLIQKVKWPIVHHNSSEPDGISSSLERTIVPESDAGIDCLILLRIIIRICSM